MLEPVLFQRNSFGSENLIIIGKPEENTYLDDNNLTVHQHQIFPMLIVPREAAKLKPYADKKLSVESGELYQW